MNDNVLLPYGSARIPVNLSPYQNVLLLTSRDVPGILDERNAILQSLRQPVTSPPLIECVHEGNNVVVIITDNTRHCPDDRLLPVILEELSQKLPRENITIVIALGLHAPLTGEQMIQKLGRDVVENYRVINHDPEQTVNLGTTSRGNPVEVNRIVMEADFRISTGFIEPHFFAGFSGGRKSIAPGVSSARAIRQNHSYDMIGHPQARAGVLEGNPVHEDMLEQAQMAGLNFIVNVIMNREKQITHVLAGDPWEAHARACRIEKEIVQVELERPVDITLVTNSGAPLDLDFYQTCKGIDTAARITRPGGSIIVVSACSNGVGADAFKDLHAGSASPAEVLEKIWMQRDGGAGWQNQILANAQLNHDIFLYSTLEEDAAESMMVHPIHSVDEGLAQAVAKLGSQAQIAIIPEGPLVFPVVKSS